MTYQPKNGTAPSDASANAAWDQIMKIAAPHALIVSAGGGVATLATPAAQRDAGIRNRVLRMELMALEEEERQS